MDWSAWHRAYDTSPALQSRLALVQAQLSHVLDACAAPAIRLISICAGDGRDVILTLASHPRRHHVHATLIERDSSLVARAHAAVAHYGLLTHIEVRHADATDLSSYQGLVPALVVVVCGVFGNVRTADTPHLVQTIRGLCATTGSVIWTRTCASPHDQHAIDQVRACFAEQHFVEHAWHQTTPAHFVVATYRSIGEPITLDAAQPLFVFTDYTKMEGY
jgi:Putative methyltransferase